MLFCVFDLLLFPSLPCSSLYSSFRDELGEHRCAVFVCSLALLFHEGAIQGSRFVVFCFLFFMIMCFWQRNELEEVDTSQKVMKEVDEKTQLIQ